jgi:hypothetical protein
MDHLAGKSHVMIVFLSCFDEAQAIPLSVQLFA